MPGHGAVAQLGERRVRNAEVRGSIPLGSTKPPAKTRNLGHSASGKPARSGYDFGSRVSGATNRIDKGGEMFFGQVEGTGFEPIEPRFNRLLTGHGRVERLWTGARWSEGPAWFGGGRYLVWSDIPNNRMLRYDETDGSVSVFRDPSNNSNGNTVDREGRLVTCEHGARRVTRTEHDGRVTVIADRFEG